MQPSLNGHKCAHDGRQSESREKGKMQYVYMRTLFFIQKHIDTMRGIEWNYKRLGI